MNIRILSEKYFNIAMLWAVLLILVIPVGIANVYLGYVLGESPCTLCWYERFGMITIGFLGLFMVVMVRSLSTLPLSSYVQLMVST